MQLLLPSEILSKRVIAEGEEVTYNLAGGIKRVYKKVNGKLKFVKQYKVASTNKPPVEQPKEQPKVETTKSVDGPFQVDKADEKFIDEYYKDIDKLSVTEFTTKVDSRFKEQYNIKLKGFNKKRFMIPHFDKLLSLLPKGMTLRNGMFKQITYRKKRSDDASACARYLPLNKRVEILDATIDVKSFVVFNEAVLGTQMASSLYHEIAHAVWAKLRNSIVRKNEQILFNFMRLYNANMENRKITSYAGTKMEECFAEYFACYYQNKKNVYGKGWIYVRDRERREDAITSTDKAFFDFIEKNITKHKFFKSLHKLIMLPTKVR